MMASAHNFISNINAGQFPLSLSTFEGKRPVFLSSTKEKEGTQNDDQKRNAKAQILAIKTKQD